jgi:hypothetical protein
MPGQIPLSTKYYPSDFQTIQLTLGGFTSADPAIAMIFYADRDVVIDSVTVMIGDGPNSDTNIRVAYVTGLAQAVYTANASSGTTFNITTVLTLTSNVPISGGPSVRYVTGDGSGFDFVKTAGAPTNNIVPAGSTIWLVANAGTLTGIERGMIQIRYRSQL